MAAPPSEKGSMVVFFVCVCVCAVWGFFLIIFTFFFFLTLKYVKYTKHQPEGSSSGGFV